MSGSPQPATARGSVKLGRGEGRRSTQARRPPPPTAAAACPLLGGGLYGVLRPRPSSPARRSGSRRRDRPRTPPAGTAAAAPAPRSRSRCSATPAPPATAWTGSRRRPARCSPAALAEQADRRVHLRAFAKVGARSSDLAGQVDRGPADRARRRGHPDRRQRRHPPGAAGPVGAPPLRGAYAGCATPASRSWSAPAPTSARSGRSRRRCKQVARTWSRRLAAAQTIAVVEAGGRTVSLGTILGPEFDAAPALLFGPDRFHPSADGYARWPPCCCRRCWPRSAWSREEEAAPEACRGEGVLPIGRGRGPGRPRPPAPSSTAPRSAAPAAASAGSGWSCGTAAARPRPTGEAPDDAPEHRAASAASCPRKCAESAAVAAGCGNCCRLEACLRELLPTRRISPS